jgi:hypothetical protein
MCLKDIIDARRFGSRTSYIVSNGTGGLLIGPSLSRIRLIIGAGAGSIFVAPGLTALTTGEGFLVSGPTNTAAHAPSATGDGVFRIEDWGRSIQGPWQYLDFPGIDSVISIHEVFLDDGWPEGTI